MDAINPAPVCYIPSARRWKHLRAHFQQGHKPQLQQSCSGNTVAWRCHNGGRRDCQKVEYSSAAARSVVGSKRGRFEPSTAAKPSENRGRMPMTPGPILNALSPLLWVRTAESQPNACLTPQVCEPGQHFRLMVFADQDLLGRDPLLFTAPILHTSFAFRPEHSINPTITHWPPPEIFITGTRSGNSPPRQRHGNSIAQPNGPSRHHDEESWRARELSRLTNHVLYMAAPLPWLRHPHARGTASATTRMKRAAQTPGSLRVYSSPGRSWVAVLR